jgi:uncharacterized protein (DUF4415 family)
MSGLKSTPDMTRTEVMEAVRAIPADKHFVWDGVDEDDRPLSREEMLAGAAAFAKKRGRPAGSGTKEQVALRVDRDILDAFRASGPGWQTRMNAVLRAWVETHNPA